MDLLKTARAGIAQRRGLSFVLVAAGVFVVYAITRRAGNPYNQYVLLTDALLHGRLQIVDPPPFLEIARFGSRAYVIDPPAPTLLLMPFVAVFGIGADHVLVSCGVGALAIAFLWTAARRLWPGSPLVPAITVLAAFGTNYWWVSSDGGFWSFAHVSAVFFLCAGLAEATGRKRPWLVGLCVGLAGLSRLPVFLIAPLYLYLVLDGDLRWNRKNIRRTIGFGSVIGMAATSYVAYNIARYGTWHDLGYFHEQYANEPWFDKGRFDITYIPRHLRAIFYEWPVFGDGFPWVRPHAVGTALLVTTPAFLYALRARLTKRNVAALVALALTCIPLLTHGAVGFSQFGYRFSLDVLPALLLLVASGMRERVSKFAVAVIAYCVVANLWGVLAFNQFDWMV